MCSGCRDIARSRGIDPGCEGCEQAAPGLEPLDDAALWIARKIGGVVFDGFGGINSGLIESAIRRYGRDLDRDTKDGIFERLIGYFSELNRKE